MFTKPCLKKGYIYATRLNLTHSTLHFWWASLGIRSVLTIHRNPWSDGRFDVKKETPAVRFKNRTQNDCELILLFGFSQCYHKWKQDLITENKMEKTRHPFIEIATCIHVLRDGPFQDHLRSIVPHYFFVNIFREWLFLATEKKFLGFYSPCICGYSKSLLVWKFFFYFTRPITAIM